MPNFPEVKNHSKVEWKFWIISTELAAWELLSTTFVYMPNTTLQQLKLPRKLDIWAVSIQHKRPPVG